MEKINKPIIYHLLINALIFGVCYFVSIYFSYFFLDEMIVLYTASLSTNVVSIILISLRFFVAVFFFFTLRGIYHHIKYSNVKTEQEKSDKINDEKSMSRMLNAFSIIFYLLLLSLSLFFVTYSGVNQINIVPFNMIREYIDFGMYIHLFVPILLFIPIGLLIRRHDDRFFLCVVVSAILFSSIEFVRYFFHIGNFEIDRILLYMIGFLLGFLSYGITMRGKKADLEKMTQSKKLAHFLVVGILFVTLSGFVASNVSLDGAERINITVIEVGQGVHFEINSDTGYIIGFSVMENEEIEAMADEEFLEFIQDVARDYFGEGSKVFQEFLVFMDSIQ